MNKFFSDEAWQDLMEWYQDRLIYRIEGETIYIAACKNHYKDKD